MDLSSLALDSDERTLQDEMLDARNLYCQILREHTCYDLIPKSGKIVIFDVQLHVKKAFFALVQNGIRSAPLWDSKRMEFRGMLTVTDFMSILCQFYQSSLVRMDELEQHRIQTWREIANKKGTLPKKAISIEPEETLYDAVALLIQKRIHRLPLIASESNTAVAILTHKRILRFLTEEYNKLHGGMPEAFKRAAIEELGIGTYANICTATPTQPLIGVLKLLLEKRISAVPIVDSDGRVTDVYSKFDVINLARERTYNDLDISVSQALTYRADDFEGVHTCQRTDSLASVITNIVNAAVHRLIIVDADRKVVGMVSLSDILSYLHVVDDDDDDDDDADRNDLSHPYTLL